MKHAKEPTDSFVILTFVLILIDIALAYLSVKFIPAYGGISLFFIAVAFMILFTLWFRGKFVFLETMGVSPGG